MIEQRTGPASSLEGKIVLVTGATGGLGRVVVKRFLDEGAVVAGVYRSEERFQDLLASLKGGRESFMGLKADLGAEAEVREMVEAVVRRHGRIDALLNLAGGYRGGADVASTGEADWDLLIRIEPEIRLPVFPGRSPGHDEGGLRTHRQHRRPPGRRKPGRAKSGAYAVSKAGVVVLTQTIAEEVRKYGITANCLVPGTIDTPKNRTEIPGGDFAKWADPEDIAEVLLYLVSDASSVVSGAAIPVYGKS